jgi:uncharacterized protein YndB with AHSA1/START domain
VRYKGNGGIYPTYECNHLRRDGLATKGCVAVRCDLLDEPVGERVLQVLSTDQIDLALRAVDQLEQRQTAVSKQWSMRVQRAEYQAQLAQRRYEEVDPAHRLVAATLEQRWNEALTQLQEIQDEHDAFLEQQHVALTPEDKQRLLAIARDFPRLWNAPTTQARDKKRMLRLLLKDITVDKGPAAKQLTLHLRWQGGACEDILVALPPTVPDRVRYPQAIVDQVRQMAQTLTDDQIAAHFNQEGRRSAKGHPFSASIISWIRYRHRISRPTKQPEELTVAELARKLGVSQYVVYYWIERGILSARRLHQSAPYWITLHRNKESELREWVRKSSRIRPQTTLHP